MEIAKKIVNGKFESAYRYFMNRHKGCSSLMIVFSSFLSLCLSVWTVFGIVGGTENELQCCVGFFLSGFMFYVCLRHSLIDVNSVIVPKILLNEVTMFCIENKQLSVVLSLRNKTEKSDDDCLELDQRLNACQIYLQNKRYVNLEKNRIERLKKLIACKEKEINEFENEFGLGGDDNA